MSVKSEILAKQLSWAHKADLQPDERGYLSSYELNLFRPLNDRSKAAFDNGSGSELSGKMRALHSSSALAVNFFNTWVGSNADPLKQILDLDSVPVDIQFEGKYPTGLSRIPPHIDVVIKLASGVTVGIESKFTEWLTSKSVSKPPLKEKYFPPGEGVWEKVGLPDTQRLANDIQSRDIIFHHLDAPQLIKHALGLATKFGSNFKLLYVYFESPGMESSIHKSEITVFTDRLRNELGFKAYLYQELITQLEICPGVSAAYLKYLHGRYA